MNIDISTTKFINALLILSTITVLGFEAHLLTRAQEGDGAPDSTEADEETGDDAAAQPEQENAEIKRCIKDMREFTSGRREEFGEFMNTHFRSAKPTSELIEAAMKHYELYRKDVRGHLSAFLPKEGTVHQGQIVPECEKELQDDFFVMDEMIKGHIVANAYAKKSTRLLDKYKELNQKLERLNFTIGQMYGYFGSLSQKLPCFPTQCSKG